jgi:molybdopterin-guanine dinucleotide biosynthesis protein B
MKIFGVTGWKNSGKTGLMERLISEFTTRGLTVSSIKHAHHSFDIDHPGRDSYRHRDAGARQVLLASRNRWALMHELRDEDEPSLGDLLKQLSPVDLVLIEGYKRDRHPKIEAHRKETGQPLIAPEDETIVAVASDTSVAIDRPVLDLNDTASIVNFIAQHLELDV